jgi:hypothetical protein
LGAKEAGSSLAIREKFCDITKNQVRTRACKHTERSFLEKPEILLGVEEDQSGYKASSHTSRQPAKYSGRSAWP